jgi:hypothetical protein
VSGGVGSGGLGSEVGFDMGIRDVCLRLRGGMVNQNMMLNHIPAAPWWLRGKGRWCWILGWVSP